MKTPAISCVILLLGLLLAAGCAYVEVAPIGESDRVLTGKVTYDPPEAVPTGAILSVRVVDTSSITSGPVLLGQQRIAISGEPPFEFRTEYRAEDNLLRRGVSVEAKILVNGKLRYGNLTTHVVTLARAAGSQEIMLFPTAP
jgi:uncharacterized lipoprotein YbaY